MAEFRKEQMKVGRVINEDDKSILLEIMKSDDTPYTLDIENPANNRFYTVLFIREDDGDVEIWVPWEEVT